MADKSDATEARGGTKSMQKQLIGGIILMLMGAVFSFLLSSSATQYRLQRNEEDIRDLRTQIGAVRQDLANGGPQPLAQRVTKVEMGMEKMQSQLDDMYKVIVLRQPVAK